MENLKLKSKAIHIADYRTVDISQFAIPLQVDEKRYEHDVLNFRKRFAATVQADCVEEQDHVTLSCQSSIPRFNKQHIVVRIGLGMFTKELEQQLIGACAGQEVIATVKGEPVTVQVESISRQIIPELTDALVKSANLDGVETVEDALFWCKGHQFDEELEDQADEVFAYIASQVMEASEIELDADELEVAYEGTALILKGSSALNGRSIEAISDEEFEETFYMSRKAMEDHLCITAKASLKSAVIGSVLMEQAGKTVTMEQYEAEIARQVEATGRSEEAIRQENPPIKFAIDCYSGYYLDLLEAYAMRKLKEVCL